MRKFFIAAATAVLTLSGCAGEQPDPVRDAIRAEILKMDQGFETVRFDSVEKVDSVTFGQELERRKKTFELKRDADEKYMIKYTNQRKPKNAAIKQLSFREDLRILTAIDSLADVMAPVMNDVAYYNYKFSAEARSGSATMRFEGSYAAITPDFELIGMASKLSDVNKGLGKVIPGYLEIVKNSEQDSAEVEE